MRGLIFAFLFAGLTLGLSFNMAYAVTDIDFDTTIGKKPVSRITDYSSKVPFKPLHKEAIKFFSGYKEDKLENNGVIYVLRLTAKDATNNHELLDSDMNGLFETWRFYEAGKQIFEARIAEQEAVIIEKTIFSPDGKPSEVLVDREKTGSYRERNVYRDGKITITLTDKDGDGLFEKEINYGAGNPKKTTEITLAPERMASDLPVFCAGFYEMGKPDKPDEKVTKAVLKALGIKDNKSETYAETLKKKYAGASGKRMYNRFEIFAAVDDIEKKSLGFYVIYGEIKYTSLRVSLNYRVIGPDAVSIVMSGVIEISRKDFSPEKIAAQLAKKYDQYKPKASIAEK